MQTRTTVVITLASFALTAIVVLNAFHIKKQFYPSVVYLTKSNISLAAIYAQAFVLVYLVAQFTRRLLFGQLRAIESEHLSERTWYAITETCLAFTVFRDDFSPRFVAYFALLLVLKCFHWLAEDRVDYMERSPLITLLFHTRLMAVLAVLSSFDSYFVSHAYFTTLLKGASVQIVFGFEYAILMTIVFHVAIKYILHSIDSRNVHPWENKAVYLLYAELVITGLRAVLYCMFVMVMIRLHTFPLFSIRPVYMTIKAFKTALNDVFMSRRAINFLNHLYPDATVSELAQSDVCIICREEMRPGQAKKLPCAHIFHASCLRSWFQRQQTCPTCRLDIIQATLSANPQAAQAGVGVDARPGAQQPAAPEQQAPVGAVPPPPFVIPNLFGVPQPPAAGSQAPPIPGAVGPFPPPPPFMGGMPPPWMSPFAPPFPLPFPMPPDFAALTDDEVRRMEDEGRRGVEARVQVLRNIQTLLDAAVVQLQQYLSIVPVLSTSSVSVPVTNDAAAAVPTATPATSEEIPTTSQASSSEPQPITPVDQAVNSEHKADGEVNPFERLASSGSSSSFKNEGVNGSCSISDEIRRRRLEHFSKTTTTQLQQNSENETNASIVD